MKKMILVLTVVFSTSMSDASANSSVAHHENIQEVSMPVFLNAAEPSVNTYTYNEEDQSDIDEYDQHVCDDVRPPKVSAAKALLTECLGSLLIRYITMKEKMGRYFKDFKDVINAWFNRMVKS